MKEYLENIDEVLSSFETGQGGLTTEESRRRLEEYGLNSLKEAPKASWALRFAEQLKDPMIIILIAAALISGITAAYTGESLADAIIILAVVLINAFLGVYQESKAEKAIEALQKMSESNCHALRDGIFRVVKSEELVPGDIILLEAGDAVPADGRLIESHSLQIEEAALTGESVPVTKQSERLEKDNVPLGDRSNMVYMGSEVSYGRGKAVVTATASSTEMGKIAEALTAAKESKTPLQIKLSQLSGILTKAVLGISIFIFILNLLRAGSISGKLVLDTFMVAVSLAVAAIPEGLAAVVTIVLSIGVTNMSKRKAIVRKLTAVETLGCAQVICSDKTGTLTQNRMSVVKYWPEENLATLAQAMTLCSDAMPDESGEAVGEPTECALVNFATEKGLDKHELLKMHPRIAEAPFDSVRKMMSTVHSDGGGAIQYTKGAPDELFRRCAHYSENGEEKPLDDAKRKEILQKNKEMADGALRVLGAALRTYKNDIPKDIRPEALEEELCFIGLCGMTDPVRPEVSEAIARCKGAGVRPVMITGDHRDTAVAIAGELGIISGPEEALTGEELDGIGEEEFDKTVDNYGAYARVQPEHKVRIVKAWQNKGCVTAMTGDGVNDAPSIKNADIGVGMGITGTDVTKNVADIILADDNFATIVGAVEEGRRIYDNIRKAIQFLLSANMSEVLSVFSATLMGFTILKPVHLLWINLITDCFPALALGTEAAEEDIMLRGPRDPKEGIFSEGLGVNVIYQGTLITLLTLAAYFLGHYIEAGAWEITNSTDGMTMAFLTMSMAEIFHSFNMRSQKESIFRMKKQNKLLWLAAAFSLIMTVSVLYIPFLAEAFGFETISPLEYALSLGIAFMVVPIVELIKWTLRISADKRT